MRKKLITNSFFVLLFILTPLVFSSYFPQPIYAGTYDTYVWQYASPQNITGTDDLKTKLDKEVNKVIAAGHLEPYRTIYGKDSFVVDWYHAYDSVYTLSLAYPYVSANTQSAIKTYLQSEMTYYPLWNATYMDASKGTRRQPDTFPDGEYVTDIQNLYNSYRNRPKLFAVYALWLYAQNTGDWNYINSNWSNITSFYNTYHSETANYYTSIAGAIGMARLAKEKPTPDTAMQTTALNDVNTGMTNGLNLTTFGQNAETVYNWSNAALPNQYWTYLRANFYMGFQFMDITPEIGRYFYDNATLKANVLGMNGSSDYSINTGEYRFPYWWMAKAPFFGKVYGEDSRTPPMLKSMIFPIEAWVKKDSASTLRGFLDVPDAPIGDYYYMQNLTRTIQSSGAECWEDITTSTQECTSSITPPPGSSPTPTVVLGNGDTNGDGVVNLLDIKAILQNWLAFLTNTIDQYGDGRINTLDFAQVVNQLPPPSTAPSPTPTSPPTTSPTPCPTGCTSQTKTFQIGSSSDDVNETDTSFDPSSTTIWLGGCGSTSICDTGLRFTNVTIPKGATIQSAHLDVQSTTAQWLTVGYNLFSELSPNSSPFSSTSKPSGRPLSQNKATVSDDVSWLANTTYSLPDMASAIQEVVNQSTWQSGNSLSIIAKATSPTGFGRKFITSFDGTPSSSPKLIITFQ